MVNNFNNIKSLLSFKEEGDFYFIQILKRRKDNPDMKSDTRAIDNFFVYSTDDLDKITNKIIEICDTYNARAYIRLNIRNDKKVAYRTNKIIADCLERGDFRGVRSAYLSACGTASSEKSKKWIIDIDTKDEDYVKGVIEFLIGIPNMLIWANLPTKNGFHIIVNGFNPNLFTNKYPKCENIELKTEDVPTILYM